MKRTLHLLLCAAVLLSACLVLASCNDHEHVFKTAWSSDEDYHWYACESEGCSEKSERAEHTFEDGTDAEGNAVKVCTVCAYESDQVSTAAPHDHSFAQTYSKSDNFHWYACTVEGCFERLGRAEHDFAMPEITQDKNEIKRVYTCSLCGHQKTETTQISSVIQGEASWTQAFDNLELVNFEMNVYAEMGEMTQHNVAIVTPNGVYYSIPGVREFYSVKNADGTYTTYAKEIKNGTDFITDATPFNKLADTSDLYLKRAATETVLAASFKDHFDSFTYDAEKGAYVCADRIKTVALMGNGTPIPMDMYCFNNVVKVADGKISHISAEYFFVSKGTEPTGEEEAYANFSYSNIGLCEVTIPQSVIQNALYDPSYEFSYGTQTGPSGGSTGGSSGTTQTSPDVNQK